MATPTTPRLPTGDPSTTGPRASTGYWEGATAPFVEAQRHHSWRAYCDELHAELVGRWAPLQRVQRALKTDLFDEAAGVGLDAALRSVAEEVHGLDVSTGVVSAAQRQHEGLAGVVTDVRRLPYAESSFGYVFSNSTLDHFPERSDIAISLRELARVTEQGGTVVVTLDNLVNPLIALRAVLPRTLLRATGVVPYYVGASLTLGGLVREVERAGLRVVDTTTIMHVPRVAAIPWSTRRDARSAADEARTVRAMQRWERLARWPTRQLTAHFVGVRAVRP